MSTALTESDEKLVQEQARIEAIRGPKGQGNYVPLPPTAEDIAWQQAQAKRQEAAKRPTALPPRPEINFLEQSRQQLKMDRHKELLKGPIKTAGRPT